MGPESKIERRVCSLALLEFGVVSLKLNVKWNVGWPDRVFFIPGGRPLFIEFKRPNERASPLQAHVHAGLRDLGYRVEVYDNVNDAINAIQSACSSMGAIGDTKTRSGVLGKPHLGRTRIRPRAW